MEFNSLAINERANKIRNEINNKSYIGKELESKIGEYKNLKIKSIEADMLEKKSMIEMSKIYSINKIETEVKEKLLCLKEKEIKEIKEIEKEIKLLKENV